MTLDEAKIKFWKLKHEVDDAKAIRMPYYVERNALADAQGKLRDRVKDITKRREHAFSQIKLGAMEMELSALARYLRRNVGDDPFAKVGKNASTPADVTEH